MQTYKGIISFILLSVILCYTPFITAQLDENKDIARQMVDAVNNRNYEIMDELFVPNFVRHCQATPNLNIQSLEKMKEFLDENEYSTIEEAKNWTEKKIKLMNIDTKSSDFSK